jgi:hypothetical protein
MDDPQPRKRGRKPYATEAERAQARKKSKMNTNNVSVDADLVVAPNRVAIRFEADFGFPPTLSQTLWHLIKKANDAVEA